MTGILFGTGIGPGDPELMTLKAVRLIRENDTIAVPGEKPEAVSYTHLENDRSGRLHGTVGTDPGNSGRKRLPGTGEEGAAVFAYAGDRYEECYREKTRRAGIWKRSCARLFGIGKSLRTSQRK